VIENVCNILGLSHSTRQHFLTQGLNTTQTAAKFVPYLLNDDQKQNQFLCVQDLPKMTKTSF
jgi:hypothetical protein